MTVQELLDELSMLPEDTQVTNIFTNPCIAKVKNKPCLSFRPRTTISVGDVVRRIEMAINDLENIYDKRTVNVFMDVRIDSEKDNIGCYFPRKTLKELISSENPFNDLIYQKKYEDLIYEITNSSSLTDLKKICKIQNID